MADDVDITPGVGKTVRAQEKGSKLHQVMVIDVGVDSTESLVQDDGSTTNAVPVIGFQTTVSVNVTRPADTTQYALNDSISDSTSAPTAFTITGAARNSGGSGVILDMMAITDNDAGTLLQGEVIIFDESFTNVNDNTAFAVSDTDSKKIVGVIPFTMEDFGNNGIYHARYVNLPYTCVGTANLRFAIRAKNAYTPASAEVLTFRFKLAWGN